MKIYFLQRRNDATKTKPGLSILGKDNAALKQIS